MNTHITPHFSTPTPHPRLAPSPADWSGPQLIALDSAGHTQSLDCPQGAEIQVLQGCIWLTCEGLSDDHFLTAGQRLHLGFAARLHLSAEGRQPARLRLLVP